MFKVNIKNQNDGGLCNNSQRLLGVNSCSKALHRLVSLLLTLNKFHTFFSVSVVDLNMYLHVFVNIISRVYGGGCVRYIFASLFFKSKRQHLSNQEKCFLFRFKSSFCSQENQILELYVFKFHDVIKCLSVKQEINFIE